MSSVPDRSEIDEEYKWDLESIYATDDEWDVKIADHYRTLAGNI